METPLGLCQRGFNKEIADAGDLLLPGQVAKTNLRLAGTHGISVVKGGETDLTVDGVQPFFTKFTTATIKPYLVNIKNIQKVIESYPYSIGRLLYPLSYLLVTTVPGVDQLTTGYGFRVDSR